MLCGRLITVLLRNAERRDVTLGTQGDQNVSMHLMNYKKHANVDDLQMVIT
jgi:hypothetical protein